MSRGELLRRLVHIGCVAFALLLRWLDTPQAATLAVCAFAFNWLVLPRVGGRVMWRGSDLSRGYSVGILAYPLAVLVMVLVFHHQLWMAAAGWGLLAVGDGMASLAGQAAGGARLPWNARKSWLGLLAFAAFGTAAAAFLAAWTQRLPLAPGAGHWPRTLAVAAALALACALVESLPTTLDDNVTVPLTVVLLLPLLAGARPSLLADDPLALKRLALGVALNTAIAVLALLVRAIDARGALALLVIGTAITLGLGLPGLALVACFFVLGTAATRLGFQVKAARGIAQERGGTRGWRHALANGGVPAVLALIAAVSPEPPRGLLVLAYAAAVATAAADTCSSEVGKAYGRRPVLITTWRPVAPGTEGAVSLEGTLGGLAAALAVALLAAATGLVGWAATPVVALAGLLGCLAESAIGAAGAGRGWTDDHLRNAANTVIGAVAAVLMARALAHLGPPVLP